MTTASGDQYIDYEGLKVDNTDGILTVTLSNPGKRNAITRVQSEELARIWDDVWRDDSVSVIILTGEGADFCSGADLANLPPSVQSAQLRRPINRNSRIAKKHVLGILDCEKPVVAKVRGAAYGLGVSLALACDMVFASPTARLCDSHVKMGIVAGDGGVLLWPLLIGMHRAKQYLLTGEPISGEKAAEIGLVNECVADELLDSRVQTMAETLRDLPPHAVAYTKASLNVAMRQMTGGAFEASVGYELYSLQTNDFKEATSAFLEKRKGVFKGD